jgi:hypothetical protein
MKCSEILKWLRDFLKPKYSILFGVSNRVCLERLNFGGGEEKLHDYSNLGSKSILAECKNNISDQTMLFHPQGTGGNICAPFVPRGTNLIHIEL